MRRSFHKQKNQGECEVKILVTGFDPFGKDTINPSIEAVQLLPDTIKDVEIIKLEIPTKFEESAILVQQTIEQEQPDYVLHIGQAGGRHEITPERVAINMDDASLADNAGNQPIDQVIQDDGEAAYFSTLPVKAMVQYMREEGVAASISNTAGTFVCNHIMYQTLYFVNKAYPAIQAGFIHIPYLPEQVVERQNIASMALDDIVRGIIAALKAIIDFDKQADLKLIGGKTH